MPRPIRDTLAVNVGRAVKEARERAGVTQAVLAARAGIGEQNSAISKIERGKVEPSIAQVVAMETALGLSRGQLFVAAGLVPLPRTTEEVISYDVDLGPGEQRALLATYRELRALTAGRRT